MLAKPQKRIAEIAAALGGQSFVLDDLHIRRLMKEAQGLLRQGSAEDAAFVYQALGNGHARLGQHEKALEAHMNAVRLEPNAPGFRNNVGWALFELGRTTEALDEWVRAMDLTTDAESDANVRMILSANIAEAFAALGQPDYASEALADAIALVDAADVNVLMLLARQAALLDEDALAIELVARAFTLTRGVARGAVSAVDVIEATPESVKSKFIMADPLGRMISKALRFRELANRPSVPRGMQVLDDGAGALRVFEEFRATRARATAEAMGDE